MAQFQLLDAPTFRPDCELCSTAGGPLVFQSAQWRVIRVEDASFPAFYRVIWRAHVGEWSSLSITERSALMEVVVAVERVLRETLAPTKINLASLGNVVPHLHWHVIARFDWDACYPAPIWAAPTRDVTPPAAARLTLALEALDARVARAVGTLAPPV